MNLWRIILFGSFFLACLTAGAQEVRTYLDRRWLETGEDMRVIVTVRGSIPLATPEFPEISGFSMGNRTSSVQNQGASRITMYEQTYQATGIGTRIIDPVIVPLQDRTFRESPGIVSVRPQSAQSMRGYAPTNLDTRFVWELRDSVIHSGQIQHAKLFLEVHPSHINNLYWDLGALAELADSLRRGPGGQWILRDSILQSMDAPETASDDWIRFPCYEVWLGTVEPNAQRLSAGQFRVQRRWRRNITYRGSREIPPRWQDEFLQITPLQWKVENVPMEVPRPAAASGPLQMHTTWNTSRLSTGESLSLRIILEGEVFMGLVPAPALDMPSSVVLRGPSIHTLYEVYQGKLLGKKTLSYSVYPAKPGTFFLRDARLYWGNPQTGVIDSCTAPLPKVSVDGDPIPQLMKQNDVERFYQTRVGPATLRPMRTYQWIKPLSWGLLVLMVVGWVLAFRAHQVERQRRRRQALRSKRFPGR